MEVSWIDAQEVARLAELLRVPKRPAFTGSRPRPVPVFSDVPDTGAESAQSPPDLAVGAPVVAVEATPVAEPAPVVEVAPPAAPEAPVASGLNLATFRERLRSIRERAIGAGLLTAPQPEPAPVDDTPPEPISLGLPAPGEPELPVEADEEEPSEDVAPVVSAPPAVEDTSAPPPTLEPVSAAPVLSFPAAPPAASFTGVADVFSQAPIQTQEEQPWNTRPEDAGLQACVPDVDTLPPLEHPLAAPPAPEKSPGSVGEKLDVFADWVKRLLGGGELLMVDEFGGLLWGPQAKSGLVLSTLMAWNAAIRASAMSACNRRDVTEQILPKGETLTVIAAPTRLGLIQVAVVRQGALSQEQAGLIRQTLKAVMES